MGEEERKVTEKLVSEVLSHFYPDICPHCEREIETISPQDVYDFLDLWEKLEPEFNYHVKHFYLMPIDEIIYRVYWCVREDNPKITIDEWKKALSGVDKLEARYQKEKKEEEAC